MSQINVTTIKSRTGSAPNFSEGLVSSGISTFTAAVSIAGTLTYDDVTNIDSVGIITAQSGVVVSGSSPVACGAGVTLDSGGFRGTDNTKIQLGIASDLTIHHNGTNSIIDNQTGLLVIKGDNIDLKGAAGSETLISADKDGAVELYHDNTKKVETISTGASVYGGLRLQGGGLMREHVNISSDALNANTVVNCSQGMVHYRSSAVGAANVQMNVISTAGINTDMAIGDAMTLNVITVAANTAHYVDVIKIDGLASGITTNWVGGGKPTDGGGSGVDTYAFNILKTANATYVVVANQVKTS
tara:strand:- start:4892 stop:5794 length:903 start_codon:yes stop_codon:yes gene_type:complete